MASTTVSPARVSAVVLAAVGFLAACSGSAGTGGEGLIEGELADQIGLGELDAECEEPAEKAEGETFTCTATTEDGQTIEFLGTMTADDEIFVNTSNLLVASDIDAIREEGARVLSEEIPATIVADDIECPEVVLLDDTGDFECEITDSATGTVFGLTVSTGGIEPGEGVRELFFQVSDEPL